MEFRAIVHMNRFGDTSRWPLRADPARRKPMRFVHHRMGQAKPTAKSDGGSNDR